MSLSVISDEEDDSEADNLFANSFVIKSKFNPDAKAAEDKKYEEEYEEILSQPTPSQQDEESDDDEDNNNANDANDANNTNDTNANGSDGSKTNDTRMSTTSNESEEDILAYELTKFKHNKIKDLRWCRNPRNPNAYKARKIDGPGATRGIDMSRLKPKGQMWWPARQLTSAERATSKHLKPEDMPSTGYTVIEWLGTTSRDIGILPNTEEWTIQFGGPTSQATKNALQLFEKQKTGGSKLEKNNVTKFDSGLEEMTLVYKTLKKENKALEKILKSPAGSQSSQSSQSNKSSSSSSSSSTSSSSKKKSSKKKSKSSQKKRKRDKDDQDTNNNESSKAKKKYTNELHFGDGKRKIQLHVGDTITYNDRQHTLGSKQARGFAVIVEFHKNVGKTGVKMELSNGYRIEDDFFKLHKRAGGLKVKPKHQVTKSLHQYLLSGCYEEPRWSGKTDQTKIDEISRKAQNEINSEITSFIKNGGEKFAQANENDSDEDML